MSKCKQESLWAGDLLRIRERHKLKQSEIAEIFHIDQAQWSRYETGKLEPPEEFLIQVLEHFRDRHLQYLLAGDQHDDLERIMAVRTAI